MARCAAPKQAFETIERIDSVTEGAAEVVQRKRP
jgi:hypothetical protein